MMQTTEPRHGNHFRIRGRAVCCSSACRSLLIQSKMRPVVVVIVEVLSHEPLAMAFIEHNHMVEQIPAAVTDEAFRYAILPRALKTGSLGLNTEILDQLNDLIIELCTANEDQVARRGIIG